MENVFRSDQHCASDDRLLGRYHGHLIERGISESARMSSLAIAARFLQWWRQSFVGEHFALEPGRHQCQMRDVEWLDLREAFLRATCPDHQLRCSQRTDLSRFLDYLAGAHRALHYP